MSEVPFVDWDISPGSWVDEELELERGLELEGLEVVVKDEVAVLFDGLLCETREEKELVVEP